MSDNEGSTNNSLVLAADEKELLRLIISNGKLSIVEIASLSTVNNYESCLENLVNKEYAVIIPGAIPGYSASLPLKEINSLIQETNTKFSSFDNSQTEGEVTDVAVKILSEFSEKKTGYIEKVHKLIETNKTTRTSNISETNAELKAKIDSEVEKFDTNLAEIKSKLESPENSSLDEIEKMIEGYLGKLDTTGEELNKKFLEFKENTLSSIEPVNTGNLGNLENEALENIKAVVEENKERMDLIAMTINSTISLIEDQYRENTQLLSNHTRSYGRDSAEVLQKASTQLKNEIEQLNASMSGISERMLGVLKEVNLTLYNLGQDNRKIFIDTKNTLEDVSDGLEKSLKEVESDVVQTGTDFQGKFTELLDDSLRDMEDHITKTETEFKGIGETLQTAIEFSLKNRMEQFMEEISEQIGATVADFKDLIEVKTLTLKKNRIEQHQQLHVEFEGRMEELNQSLQTKVQSQRLQQGLKLSNLRSQYERVTEKAENLLMATIETTDKEFADSQQVIDSSLELLTNWALNVEEQIVLHISDGRQTLEEHIAQTVTEIELSLNKVKENVETSNATLVGELGTQIQGLLDKTGSSIQEVTSHLKEELEKLESSQSEVISLFLTKLEEQYGGAVGSLDTSLRAVVIDHLNLIIKSVKQVKEDYTSLMSSLKEYTASFGTVAETQLKEMGTTYTTLNEAESITLDKSLTDLVNQLEELRTVGLEEYTTHIQNVLSSHTAQNSELKSFVDNMMTSLNAIFGDMQELQNNHAHEQATFNVIGEKRVSALLNSLLQNAKKEITIGGSNLELIDFSLSELKGKSIDLITEDNTAKSVPDNITYKLTPLEPINTKVDQLVVMVDDIAIIIITIAGKDDLIEAVVSRSPDFINGIGKPLITGLRKKENSTTDSQTDAV